MYSYSPTAEERPKTLSQPRIGLSVSDFYGGNAAPSLLMANGRRVHSTSNRYGDRPPELIPIRPIAHDGLRNAPRPATAPYTIDSRRRTRQEQVDERFAETIGNVLPREKERSPIPDYDREDVRVSPEAKQRPASAAASEKNVARQRLNRTFYSSCFNRVPSRFIRSNYSHDKTFERAQESSRGTAPTAHELGDPSSAVVKSLDMPDRYRPIRSLPSRFQDAETQDRPIERQHPLYRTSSHEYGMRPPAQHELPRVYYSPDYSFTKTFVAGAKREGAGLDTSIKNPPLWEQHNYGFV